MHSEKAAPPILDTLEGILTEVKLEQLDRKLVGIVVTLLPISTEHKVGEYAKDAVGQLMAL